MGKLSTILKLCLFINIFLLFACSQRTVQSEILTTEFDISYYMICNYKRGHSVDCELHFINQSSDAYVFNSIAHTYMAACGATEPPLIGWDINTRWTAKVPKELLPGDTLVLPFTPTFQLPLLKRIFDGYILHLQYINIVGQSLEEHDVYHFSPVKLR